MLLFVQVVIIDIQIGRAALYAGMQKLIQVMYTGADQVRPYGFHLVFKKLSDDPVEFPEIAGCSEGIF